jgi:hypothetical protein
VIYIIFTILVSLASKCVCLCVFLREDTYFLHCILDEILICSKCNIICLRAMRTSALIVITEFRFIVTID